LIFYDRLKTVSKDMLRLIMLYWDANFKLSKVDILDATVVDALSLIHVDNAYHIGKKMCEKLKELIPRQQFDIPFKLQLV
jgi:GTP-binding protein LepA